MPAQQVLDLITEDGWRNVHAGERLGILRIMPVVWHKRWTRSILWIDDRRNAPDYDTTPLFPTVPVEGDPARNQPEEELEHDPIGNRLFR